MKLFITAILFFTVKILSGQDSLAVKEVHDAISKGHKPGYSVFIPKTNFKDITNLWKKQLKNDSRADVMEKKNELITSKSILSSVSTDSVIVYSKITNAEPEKGTMLSVFVQASDESFITNDDSPAISSAIKSYMRAFAVNQYRIAVTNELSAEQKVLNVLKEDLKRLERDNENCVKKINSGRKSNEKYQEEISANTDNLETKNSEVAQQMSAVQDMPPSAQREDEVKKLKQMQKEQSKLVEEIAKLNKNIGNNNGMIEDMQKKQELNTQTNIPKKKEEIEAQSEKVSALSKKLNSIR